MENSARQFHMAVYTALYEANGPLQWWPGETPFEIMLGAILTQSCAWRNVEMAIRAIRDEDALSPTALAAMDDERLHALIRPTGYYRQKAKKLKAFLSYFKTRYDYSVSAMKKTPMETLRKELLAVWGVGEETCDSILCYALAMPIMVVDAYTRRMFHRMGKTAENATYAVLQAFFMENLENDASLFNEYHAQIVINGKDFCKKTPRCDGCPLKRKRLCEGVQ